MQTSWFTPIDNYCERLAPGFWAEPLNAASNGAFLIAAVYAFTLWQRAGARDWPVLWLIAVTAIVGAGSFLFHTFANRWSLLADVLPIAVFIYSYFLLAMRRFVGLGVVSAVVVTALFAVFNMSFTRLWLGVFSGVTLNGSIGYLPAALAMLGVGLLCILNGLRTTGQGLVAAGCLFALSLVFRSIDHAVCTALPVGTHYLWHAFNALVLAMLMRTALHHSAGEGTNSDQGRDSRLRHRFGR